MQISNSAKKIFEIIKFHCKEKNYRFILHNCSQCEYPCSFFWENDQLMFDSGCWCLAEKELPKKMPDIEFINYIKNNPEQVEKKLKELHIILT